MMFKFFSGKKEPMERIDGPTQSETKLVGREGRMVIELGKSYPPLTWDYENG